MIITIKNVLSTTVVKQVQSLLEAALFVDGKLSAGDSAASVKNNLELSLQSPLHQQLNNLVIHMFFILIFVTISFLIPIIRS